MSQVTSERGSPSFARERYSTLRDDSTHRDGSTRRDHTYGLHKTQHSPPQRDRRDKSPPAKRHRGPRKQYYDIDSYKGAFPLGRYDCKGEDDPWSNFYYCVVVIFGKKFKAAECRYVWSKHDTLAKETKSEGLKKKAQKLYETCKTGREAQREGKVKDKGLLSIWNPKRVQEQTVIFQHKWVQNQGFRDIVKSTRGKVIVHEVPHEWWGTYHYEDGAPVSGGRNMFGKMAMVFTDIVLPDFAADYNRLPEDLRQEMNDLKREMTSYIIREDKISSMPTKSANEVPPVPEDSDVSLFVGDSIFNDGRERATKNMIFLSLNRDNLGPHVYVAAFTGNKIGDIMEAAQKGCIARKIPRAILSSQVKEIILGGGINDLLDLTEKRGFENSSRSEREGAVGRICESFVQAVSVLQQEYTNARVTISQVMAHPRLMDRRFGPEVRQSLAYRICSRLQGRCPVFLPVIPDDAWANKENDGLHLSVKGKKAYAEQLKKHFASRGAFR